MFLLVAMLPVYASAAIIVLGDADVAADDSVPIGYTQWEGQSFFSTDEAEPVFVQSLRLAMTMTVPNSNFKVMIVGEENFRPNLADLIVDFDITPLNEGIDPVFMLFPKGAYQNAELLPETNYWIVAGATAPDPETFETGIYHWSYILNTPAVTSVGGWNIGTSIASAGTAGDGWIPQTDTPYLFSLTAIPEPRFFAVGLGLGMAIFVGWRRKHRFLSQ